MANIYLGRPSANIENWILNHQPKGMFDILSENIEKFNDCTIESSVEERLEEIDPYVLPKVGSTILVDYVVDPTVGPVKTEWQVLGYNMSIPERIKYKNGNDLIYVTTIGPGGLLSSIVGGTLVYVDKSSSDSIGTVLTTSGVNQTIDGNLGTYGNNNPYNAPTSVTVEGTEYSFAGYNMTLMSKCGLVVKYNGELYHYPQFNSNNHTDWSASQIRTWMNGSSAVENQKWYLSDGTTYTTGTITGLISHLPDEKFLKAVSPCVNRTWVHDSWRSDKILDSNDCEHVVDKFWLLGEGNVNTAKDFLNDDAYDTSKFTGVFTSDTNSVRIRNYMNEDGSEGDAWSWWLRSASSKFASYVGCVNSGGKVANSVDDYRACLPVCLIQ